jgi:uncharacterized protein (TIGR02284 family)
MANNHDVDALEALTSTLTDSINGYEEAAEVASDAGISSFLRQKARERRGVTSEFRSKIASLGGKSDVSGSATAALHRRFLDLRSMFLNDTKAAIAEVERGERYLKERFETYMADQNVSATTRDLIRSTYERVRFDHARWDQLKQATQRSSGSPSYRGRYGQRHEGHWSEMADSRSVMALAIGAGLGLLAGSLVSIGSGQQSRIGWQGDTGRRWSGSGSSRASSVEADETTDLIASNKVEGTAVYDRQGNKLGEVYNFMVGKRSGRVAYAVMSFGGLLGMGSSHYPLPWSALDYDTEKGGYVVDIDKERLSSAPSHRPDEDAFVNPGYSRSVTDYWSGANSRLTVFRT